MENVLTEVKKLLNKADKAKEEFAQAKEKAENEVSTLQKEIQENEAEIKELYKNYVLDIISLDAYNEIKKEHDNRKKMLQIAQSKIDNIDSVLKDELYAIYCEYKALQSEFYYAHNQAKEKQHYQLVKAKMNYLNEIQKISKEYTECWKLDAGIEYLRVDAGIKNNAYIGFEPPFAINDFNAGDIDITKDELRNTYRNKNISKKLVDAYNKGKELGYIE